ncbi:MAG TPA: hypothetical protein VL027_01845 [Spongiibacteraceae bacterium]|nr:hypothetical protein [Spongiibacteraceae bacterium]
MGLRRSAAIVGMAQFKPRKMRDLAGVGTCLEQMATLSLMHCKTPAWRWPISMA